MLGPDRWRRQIGALGELNMRDLRRDAGGLDDLGRKLIRVRDRVEPRPLVDRQDAPHEVGVTLCEGLADIEDAIGVEGRIAVEKHRADLDLRLGHVGIEACPRVDLLGGERPIAVRMLQQHGVDIGLAESLCIERPQKEDVGVSAARDGDGLALQVLDPG